MGRDMNASMTSDESFLGLKSAMGDTFGSVCFAGLVNGILTTLKSITKSIHKVNLLIRKNSYHLDDWERDWMFTIHYRRINQIHRNVYKLCSYLFYITKRIFS